MATELDAEAKKLYAFGFQSYPELRDQQVMPKTHDWLALKRHVDDLHYRKDPKQRDSNDENRPLWRVHDKLYDLTNFQHPGGQRWIQMTKDTDITELFETSHVHIEKARQLLAKYYVRDCEHPRYTAFLTFRENGFYDTLRKRAARTLDASTKKEGPTYWQTSNFIHDSLLVGYLILQVLLVLHGGSNPGTNSWISLWVLTLLAGIDLGLLGICAHNYFHMKDNWRMFSFDLAMVSSNEWRVTHAYSHHNFPNSVMDFEIQAFEPMLNYFPYKHKSNIGTKLGTMFFVAVAPLLASIVSSLQRWKFVATGVIPFRWEFALPYINAVLCVALKASQIGDWKSAVSITLWRLFGMHVLCSLVFIQVGLAAGHHHPHIWHAGDGITTSDEKELKSLDFGIFQLIAVGGKPEVDSSHALAVVSFGQHALHHLFPTVDHARLHELEPALRETCREFNINELFVGSHPEKDASAWTKRRTFTPWQSWIGMVQQAFRSTSSTTNFPHQIITAAGSKIE